MSVKKDFNSVFGIENPDSKLQTIEIKPAEKEKLTPNNLNVAMSHNPMGNLHDKYSEILRNITEENNDVLSGFIKKRPQIEIYANTTIQVHRELYKCICEYISDMKMGKAKILNEIFMLGVSEFISKYSKRE